MMVEAPDRAAARAVVDRLAGELLANPLIERYEVRTSAARPPRRPGPAPDGRPRRRGRLPGLQLRAGHDLGPRPRRRRAGSSSGTSRPAFRRGFRSGVAGWLRLRRLPAGRRHRPLQPGDARRCRLRRRGAAWCWGSATAFRFWPRQAYVPGALLRNRGLRFVCREVAIARAPGHALHAADRGAPSAADAGRPREGYYYADAATLDALKHDGRVLFRYVGPDGVPAGETDDPANPNGSLRAIADHERGRERGRPHAHPERAAEALLGPRTGCRSCARSWRRPASGRRRAVRLAPRPVRHHDAGADPLHRALGLTDRGARRDRGEAAARPERPRARDVQRHVEQGLLTERPGRSSRPCPPVATTWSPNRQERRRAADRRRPRGRVQDRVRNHPSAVEPYQGAATGVGGILRDIFAMGAGDLLLQRLSSVYAHATQPLATVPNSPGTGQGGGTRGAYKPQHTSNHICHRATVGHRRRGCHPRAHHNVARLTARGAAIFGRPRAANFTKRGTWKRS